MKDVKIKPKESKKRTIKKRASEVSRKTSETAISIKLRIDGSGKFSASFSPKIEFLGHMLSTLAKHSGFDLEIKATGDNKHHLAEDIAICLGKALSEALGEKKSIKRFGFATVPMDDALAMAAVDLGGRSYFVSDLNLRSKNIEDMSSDMVSHFFETLTSEARINLHISVLRGKNEHHKVEAVFKALAAALKMATSLEEGRKGEIPSTKGVI